METISKLPLTPLVFIVSCFGLLLPSTIAFFILSISTKEKLHFAAFLLGLSGSFFIGNEIVVMICSYENALSTGMMFHRLQGISVASFVVNIPLLLGNIVEFKSYLKKFNNLLIVSGVILFITLVVISFVSPELFISQTVRRSNSLLGSGWHAARGEHGVVYNLRDIYIFILIIYSFVFLMIELLSFKRMKFLINFLIGILFAVFTAVYDLISLRLSSESIFFKYHNFSFFTIGVTVFIFLSMLAILQQFIHQSEEVEKANRIRYLGFFAGGIAHDFNNLLAVIMGNISIIKEKSSNEEINTIVNEIDDASVRAEGLTQQLLTFSKGGVPVKTVLSGKEVIRNTSELVLSGSNLKVDITIDDDLLNIYADRGQVEQVLQNILLNSRQVLKKNGTVTVRAENYINSNSRKLKNKKYIKITIADNGEGISRKDKKRIFEPYFTTKEGGTGLGLAISYSIIKKHDGHIRVISKKGEGTAFEIMIPSTEKALTARKEKSKEQIKKSGTVLLMDDEEMVLKMGKKMLVLIGFETDCAKNGEEALLLYQRKLQSKDPYDLVIVDLTVPGGMGGEETASKILGINPEAKIIVSSGYSNDPVISEYKKYGFSGMVKKPYSIDDLTSVMDEIFNHERSIS